MSIQEEINRRLKVESSNFDQIAATRSQNNKLPDLRRDFFNPYFFNNIWRKSSFLQQEYGPLVDWIVTELKRHGVKKVVDVGCGDGWLSLELARAGFEVVGCDISQGSIDVCNAYLETLPERKSINLTYYCGNSLDVTQLGGSLVCFGSLHHFHPILLDEFLQNVSKNLPRGQVLLSVEPTYDKTTDLGALITYALRRSFPCHLEYHGDIRASIVKDLTTVKDELAETEGDQSEMDNESPSQAIVDAVKKVFPNMESAYYGGFYDKVMGGLRVTEADEEKLAVILKELDQLIAKYNPTMSRMVKIKAVKE